jgi:hypothetical protein
MDSGSKKMKRDECDWVSLVPYGLGEQHPNAEATRHV